MRYLTFINACSTVGARVTFHGGRVNRVILRGRVGENSITAWEEFRTDEQFEPACWAALARFRSMACGLALHNPGLAVARA